MIVKTLVSALKQIHQENTMLLKAIFYDNIILSDNELRTEDKTAEDNIRQIISDNK